MLMSHILILRTHINYVPYTLYFLHLSLMHINILLSFFSYISLSHTYTCMYHTQYHFSPLSDLYTSLNASCIHILDNRQYNHMILTSISHIHLQTYTCIFYFLVLSHIYASHTHVFPIMLHMHMLSIYAYISSMRILFMYALHAYAFQLCITCIFITVSCNIASIKLSFTFTSFYPVPLYTCMSCRGRALTGNHHYIYHHEESPNRESLRVNQFFLMSHP